MPLTTIEIDNMLLRQQDEYDKRYASIDDKNDLWKFARTRAHKGMTWIVVGLFAALLSIGVKQFYWASGKFEDQIDKIHKLELRVELELNTIKLQEVEKTKTLETLSNTVQILTDHLLQNQTPSSPN